MKRYSLLFSLLFTLAFVNSASAKEPYKTLKEPQPTQVAEGKVEVVEVFWYGCPHCYDFEPYIKNWMKKMPENVEFRRVPGIFRESWIPHARAYFTALELGVLEQIHGPLFDAMHKEKKPMNNQSALRSFFVEHGVDGKQFDEVYESDSVNDKVKESFKAGRKYQIRGVPSIVVNGKYLVGTDTAGGQENMLKVVNELVDKES